MLVQKKLWQNRFATLVFLLNSLEQMHLINEKKNNTKVLTKLKIGEMFEKRSARKF